MDAFCVGTPEAEGWILTLTCEVVSGNEKNVCQRKDCGFGGTRSDVTLHLKYVCSCSVGSKVRDGAGSFLQMNVKVTDF